jgi:hypothetical protein
MHADFCKQTIGCKKGTASQSLTQATTTHESASQLAASIAAANIAAAGTANVTVVNPSPEGGRFGGLEIGANTKHCFGAKPVCIHPPR